MSVLSPIGIVLIMVSIYFVLKNLDDLSGNILPIGGAGFVLGLILFIVGLQSKEDYIKNHDDNDDQKK